MLAKPRQAVQWFLRTLDTHPIMLSMATLTGFTLMGAVGWNILESRQRQQQQRRDERGFVARQTTRDEQTPRKSHQRHPISLQEAQLRAMIENARESTWQQNLENAVTAHRRFMLPGREHNNNNNDESGRQQRQAEEQLVANIEQRSVQILKQQELEMEREKKRKATVTRFWNS